MTVSRVRYNLENISTQIIGGIRELLVRNGSRSKSSSNISSSLIFRETVKKAFMIIWVPRARKGRRALATSRSCCLAVWPRFGANFGPS